MSKAWQSLYPVPDRRSRGMSESPILIDGMKLLFDAKAALMPVDIELETPNHDSESQSRTIRSRRFRI